jgi:hypothetical protein
VQFTWLIQKFWKIKNSHVVYVGNNKTLDTDFMWNVTKNMTSDFDRSKCGILCDVWVEILLESTATTLIKCHVKIYHNLTSYFMWHSTYDMCQVFCFSQKRKCDICWSSKIFGGSDNIKITWNKASQTWQFWCFYLSLLNQ